MATLEGIRVNETEYGKRIVWNCGSCGKEVVLDHYREQDRLLIDGEVTHFEFAAHFLNKRICQGCFSQQAVRAWAESDVVMRKRMAK